MNQSSLSPAEITGITSAQNVEPACQHTALECSNRSCAQHRDLWRHYEDNIAQNLEVREATKRQAEVQGKEETRG